MQMVILASFPLFLFFVSWFCIFSFSFFSSFVPTKP